MLKYIISLLYNYTIIYYYNLINQISFKIEDVKKIELTNGRYGTYIQINNNDSLSIPQDRICLVNSLDLLLFVFISACAENKFK